MLKVHFDKNNSREYIAWVEKQFVVKESNLSFSKASLKKLNNQNKKKDYFYQEEDDKVDFFKNFFNNFNNKNG